MRQRLTHFFLTKNYILPQSFYICMHETQNKDYEPIR